MPTNRTRRKRARTDLDEHKLGQLLHGPDHCLLAGVGYHCPETRQFYADASQEARAVILDAMRADWRLHREIVIAAADGEPWAARTFGRYFTTRFVDLSLLPATTILGSDKIKRPNTN